MAHTCEQCRYLTRTSPEQVFLKCLYWSKHGNGIKDDKSYAIAHCHMDPKSPACPVFAPIKERREGDGRTVAHSFRARATA